MSSESRLPIVCGAAVRRALLTGMLLFSLSGFAVAEDYATYDEAMEAAQKALKAKNYLASQEPLEAALKLAKDDFTRIRVYRQLFPAYRLQPEIGSMLAACEFILDHSTGTAEKSLTRRELINFIRQRGKADSLIEHFEKRLSADAKDQTALFVLSEAYAELKDDPEKGASYLERLTKLIEESDQEADVLTYAKLATLYVQSEKYQQGAELYEKIAPKDESMKAWHWKEAAAAWLKAGDKEKALLAAQNATKSGPEARSQLLIYYWNRNLGDIYLELESGALAVPHYEAALKATKIKGYLDATKEKLKQAQELKQ